MAFEQEKISVDGTLTTLDKANLDIRLLLGQTLLYATINTLQYKPLHLGQKLSLLIENYESLYGLRPEGLTAKSIAKEIHDLLYFGLYPEGGNTINIYLLPPCNGEVRRIMVHEAVTPYEGYGLLAVRPAATIAGYDMPLERFSTTLSLSAARFTDLYAERNNDAIALRANRAGALLSSGDNPLFVLKGHTLLTAPIAEGGRASVERELMFRLAELAKVKIAEQTPTVEDIEEYSEIMVMTPVGIQSVRSVGEIELEHIYATALAKHLPTLTREGFAR
jgi:branched-subunit amino acid aminotransferase/4-amino-4-deoxychorismate lyase